MTLLNEYLIRSLSQTGFLTILLSCVIGALLWSFANPLLGAVAGILCILFIPIIFTTVSALIDIRDQLKLLNQGGGRK